MIGPGSNLHSPRVAARVCVLIVASLVWAAGHGCSHGNRGEKEPSVGRKVKESGRRAGKQPPPPSAGPAAALASATKALLDHTSHSNTELENARRIVEQHEKPRRYEERGEADGKPYYYAREVYPGLGLIIHLDGRGITRVQRTTPGSRGGQQSATGNGMEDKR